MRIRKINELFGNEEGTHEPDDSKGYIQNYTVIDPQYGNVPERILNLILRLGNGQDS